MYSEPDGDVGVGWGAGAASVLLLAEGLDQDRVGDGTCVSLASDFFCYTLIPDTSRVYTSYARAGLPYRYG